MEYIESYGKDLFSLPNDYMLVHCVSSDFALGAGIAKTFRDKYGVRDELITLTKPFPKDIRWRGVGYCIFTEHEQCPWIVANLVTKERYFDKPTYQSLMESLLSMKDGLKQLFPKVKKIGMPLIGCGLDGLEWAKVSMIIKAMFAATDLDIEVCILNQKEK